MYKNLNKKCDVFVIGWVKTSDSMKYKTESRPAKTSVQKTDLHLHHNVIAQSQNMFTVTDLFTEIN